MARLNRADQSIQHNFDSPGKIGTVGGLLGQHGVNIKFMSVAPITHDENVAPSRYETLSQPEEASSGTSTPNGTTNEALMILGVDRKPADEVVKSLIESEGILDATVVEL